jgi:hypothetical protein
VHDPWRLLHDVGERRKLPKARGKGFEFVPLRPAEIIQTLGARVPAIKASSPKALRQRITECRRVLAGELAARGLIAPSTTAVPATVPSPARAAKMPARSPARPVATLPILGGL